jgi:quercetin dioxygenase-like cupin family protein
MLTHKTKVTPWGAGERPSESEIEAVFAKENLRPYRWSNGPHDVYSTHSHAYHKVIIVSQGSITFGLPDQGQEVELFAGDRLDLPPGIRHNAVVGPQGVVCLEAQR